MYKRLSSSCESREKDSTAQSLADYDSACIDAAALGITICAAAGDHGSSDTDPADKRATVDFPASSPHVLACGGTHLTSTGDSPSIRILKIDNKGRHNRRVRLGLTEPKGL